MLEESLAKTYNLLASGYYYPKTMILNFAEKDPESVRAAFRVLYDESRDLEERVRTFWEFAEDRKANHNPEGWKNHYQNTNAISIYLWLRYPDKYYIYKYSECLSFAKAMESDILPKHTSSPSNLILAYRLYDTVCHQLQQDQELRLLLKKLLPSSCYPDSELKTATTDIVYFFYHKYLQADAGDNRQSPASAASEFGDYTKADFLEEVYLPEEGYDTLVSLLRKKRNLILQGPPGVGKTFAAKRLAYSMMGIQDESRVQFIQFHQNYSYEDFVMGYKPNGEGFQLTEGIFYRFCNLAKDHPEQEYFFIIDEINRGNMGKIFGELLMLIERLPGYRNHPVLQCAPISSSPKPVYSRHDEYRRQKPCHD